MSFGGAHPGLIPVTGVTAVRATYTHPATVAAKAKGRGSCMWLLLANKKKGVVASSGVSYLLPSLGTC